MSPRHVRSCRGARPRRTRAGPAGEGFDRSLPCNIAQHRLKNMRLRGTTSDAQNAPQERVGDEPVYFDLRLWRMTGGLRGRIALAVLFGLLALGCGIARFVFLGQFLARVF